MQNDSKSFSSISATTSAFELKGGAYAVSVIATFGGGSVKLQAVGPDGTTMIAVKQAFDDGSATIADIEVGNFGANGQKVLLLAPGQYKFVIATATAVYASAVRIPGD